jgi:hypothetical protein
MLIAPKTRVPRERGTVLLPRNTSGMAGVRLEKKMMSSTMAKLAIVINRRRNIGKN